MLSKSPPRERFRVELVSGVAVEICEMIEREIMLHELPIYVAAGQLVIAIEADTIGEDEGEYVPTRNVRLLPLTISRMLHIMEECCFFLKWDGRKKDFVATEPPEFYARLILSRVGHWPFPEVTNIVAAQTLDKKGEIINEPGVHRPSRLLLAGLPVLPSISTSEEKSAAIDAIDVLNDLITEYSFVGEASRSVALSMLITPVCRGILPMAPMHAVTAPTPGSGKSYLSTLASLIATGRPCPVIPPAEKGEEFEKRLTAVMMSGMPIISLDNVVARVNSALLCQALTEPVVDVRPLGTSNLIRIEQRVTWFVNGNNLTIIDDLTRRCILATVDRNEERPEEFEYRQRPDRLILADRGKYVHAALTVVSSYIKAKRPVRLTPLASYEHWSKTVREALVWLGYEDPCISMGKLRQNDEERAKAESIFNNWPEQALNFGPTDDKRLTAAELIMLNGPSIEGEYPWKESLKMVAQNGKGDVDARAFGYWLRRWKGRVVAGRKLIGETDRNRNLITWGCIHVGSPNSSPELDFSRNKELA